MVVLKLSQVLHFGRGATPPPNLKPCLVFLATERQRLQRRISELHVEKQQETKHFALVAAMCLCVVMHVHTHTASCVYTV